MVDENSYSNIDEGVPTGGTTAYNTHGVDLHAGYEPPRRTMPAETQSKGNSTKLLIIIILLACILAVNAVTMVKSLSTPNFGLRNSQFFGNGTPNFSQNQNPGSGSSSSSNG